MQGDQSVGAGALKRLEVFIGEWEERVSLARQPQGPSGLRVGTFGDRGDRIAGTWETSHDRARWERDFDLTYTRLA
jgi:hypothetical protein